MYICDVSTVPRFIFARLVMSAERQPYTAILLSVLPLNKGKALARLIRIAYYRQATTCGRNTSHNIVLHNVRVLAVAETLVLEGFIEGRHRQFIN